MGYSICDALQQNREQVAQPILRYGQLMYIMLA